MTDRRSWCVIVGLAVAIVLGPLRDDGFGQQRDLLQGLPNDLTAAEVQQLFDAFELVRAQEMLGLTDEQYPDFVAKLKSLQDVRRDGQRERQRLLRELQRLSNQPGTNDTMLAERLADLTELGRRATEAERTAVAEIDALLNVRQQARFRFFEQAMERRRLELLMRARRPAARRPAR